MATPYAGAIKRGHKAGKTQTAIAAELGVHHYTVCRHAKKLGLKFPLGRQAGRAGPQNPKRYERIVELVQAGHSIGAVAKRYRITRQAVSAYLKSHGPSVCEMHTRQRHHWIAAEEAVLRRLWKKRSLTTQDIADQMGFGKNQVIGKAHRLNLPPRPRGRRQS